MESGAIAFFHRRGVKNGFEGRARLPPGLGGPVEGAVAKVLAPHEHPDLAGLELHGDQRRLDHGRGDQFPGPLALALPLHQAHLHHIPRPQGGHRGGGPGLAAAGLPQDAPLFPQAEIHPAGPAPVRGAHHQGGHRQALARRVFPVIFHLALLEGGHFLAPDVPQRPPVAVALDQAVDA